MTTEEKAKTGSDIAAVASGELADAIETWLNACAAKGIEPRCAYDTTSVTLRAGDRSWKLTNTTPESVKAALLPFKGDKRFQRDGVKRNGYTSCMYLLSPASHEAPKSHRNGNGRGTAESVDTDHTPTSVQGAARAVAKCETKLADAEQAVKDARANLDAARSNLAKAQAEAEAHKAEAEAKAIKQAQANKEALEARLAKLAAEQAKLAALLAKVNGSAPTA